MRILARCSTLVLAFATVASLGASAQMGDMKMPAEQNAAPAGPMASPPATAETTVGGTKITINYSSPAMRGRVIMGGLVPYGQVWRTGANPATSFVTTGNLKIGTLSVPAGKYTLYTMPAAPGKPWQLIISKETGQWGTVYKPEMDLGRTPLHFDKLPAPQESMTISFDKSTKQSTELHIKWETTDESVKIETVK